MAVVDYLGGMGFIESFMTDSCIIRRDPHQVYDDILDIETLELVRKQDDETAIYTGKCVVKRPRADTQRPVTEGGQELSETSFRVLFPLSVSDIRLGDMIYITGSRDTAIVGRRLRVMNVDAGTHAVYRGVFTQDITTAQPFEG